MIRIYKILNLKVPLMYALICIIFYACSDYPDLVKQALKMAGNNKQELEKVINHYRVHPEDSLKLKAAYFLIGNMPGKYSLSGDLLEQYKPYFFEASKNPRMNQTILDSLRQLYGPITEERLSVKMDVQWIKADYLINNIDQAFKKWQTQPWGKYVSFDNFCEYILPYRLRHEPLENWRDSVYNEYKGFIESVTTDTIAPLEICDALFYKIWNTLRWKWIKYPYQPGPTLLLKTQIGDCITLADYYTYVCRSAGIPVAEDAIILWAEKDVAHEVNSVITKNDSVAHFYGFNASPKSKIKIAGKISKIFRRSYSLQNDALSLKIKNINDIPPYLSDPCLVDITDEYTLVSDINLKVTEPPFSTKYVYLATFNSMTWNPICYSKLERGNYASFKKLGRDVIYLPVYYGNYETYIAGNPFYVDRDNEQIVKLEADTVHLQTMSLNRKFGFQEDLRFILNRIKGSKFQVANHANFSDAITVHTIIDAPMDLYNDLHVDLNKPYRYARYLAPEHGCCDIAELEFYDEKDRKITRKIIGTDVPDDPCKFSKPIRNQVFDGDVLTSFDAPPIKGCWVGMDFGKSIDISRICYVPRNDDNFVVPGQYYELLWFGKKGWVSTGIREATAKTFVAKNVPSNGLYWLRNHSKGKEEHIFIYKDGKQIFY